MDTNEVIWTSEVASERSVLTVVRREDFGLSIEMHDGWGVSRADLTSYEWRELVATVGTELR